MALFTPNVQTFVDAIKTFSDAEKVAFSELIFTDMTQGSEISKYHEIRTGIYKDAPIPFMDRGEDWEYMKSMAGATSLCDDQPCDTNITTSVKSWDPAIYKCTNEYCFQDLDYKIKDYFNSERWLDEFDEGTFYARFMADLVSQRIKNSHWTKTYFAAKSSANTALNGHDGLFVQYAAAAQVANTEQRVVIAKNAGATYATQKLDATDGFDTFNSMYELFEDSRKMRTRRDGVIKTTRALAYNYLRWLRDQKQVTCCERDPLTGIYSIDNLSIFGMKIEVVDEWDYIIDSVADFNNGAAHVNPHRAVVSFRDNEPIGTGDGNRLSSFDVKYDDYSEKTKLVAKYSFDVKQLEDDKVILAM